MCIRDSCNTVRVKSFKENGFGKKIELGIRFCSSTKASSEYPETKITRTLGRSIKARLTQLGPSIPGITTSVTKTATSSPVAYTHLDVYKRQEFSKAPRFSRRSSGCLRSWH